MRIGSYRSFVVRTVLLATIAVAVFLVFAGSAWATVAPPTVLDNDTVELGVSPEGILGAPGGSPSSGSGTTNVGLRFSPTGNEGVSAGGAQEGWGVADAASGTTGSASGNNEHGNTNVTVTDFTTSETAATSVVEIAGSGASSPSFRVTHDFRLSSTPNLFAVTVIVRNTGPVRAEDVRYRRVVDWDTEPTPFDEFVSVDGERVESLLFSSNEGFADPDPLSPRENYGATGFFTDYGPDDQGTLLEFGLGALKPGAKKTFKLFFGATANEADALAAVETVGAEVYSFGQPNSGSADGSPNTFVLAYQAPGANTPPVAGDDTLEIDEDRPATLDILANDTDADADFLDVVSFTQPENGRVECSGSGSCTYTPNEDFNGTDPFAYTIDDGFAEATAVVDVTVRPVNDVPKISEVRDQTTDEDTPVGPTTFTVGDAETPADELAVTGSSDNQELVPNGNTAVEGTGAGRTVTVTPAKDRSGTAEITLTAGDGGETGQSTRETFSVTVNPVNDTPTATVDTYEMDEDGALTVDTRETGVLGNDSDTEGSPLTAETVDGPANGSLTLNADGSFAYTPGANFNGAESFTYKACDDATPQACSEPAKATINVRSINDPPEATDDNATTPGDLSPDVDVLTNDADADRDRLSVTEFTQGANGTVTRNPDGTLKYAPDVDFVGDDSFSYTVSDGNGANDTATVTVTVTPAVNDAPVSREDAYETDEDKELIVPAPGVLANDTDAEDDPLTTALATTPKNGTLTLNEDGSFSYSPKVDFGGTDSFTYKAGDGTDNGNAATVAITIRAVNDPPTASNDATKTLKGTPKTFGVLANDSDPEGDRLAVVNFTQGANGKVSCTPDGQCTYTPNTGFTGTDTFSYTISDGNGGTATGTVRVSVEVPPPPPETTITSGPSGFVGPDPVSFSFSSDVADARFQCRLDGAAFEACASSKGYASLAVGSHTFEVRAVDSFDRPDLSPANRTFTVDAAPPSTTPPVEGFAVASQLGIETVPVRLNWSATDAGSGVARYELEESVDGGAYSPVILSAPASTTLTLLRDPDREYRFRVRAQDKAGNWSGWREGTSFMPIAYQEANPMVTFPSGTWSLQAIYSAFGGYVRYASVDGAKARFDFTGRQIAYVAPKGPNRGKAEILIDGTRVATVDLYASTSKPRQVVFAKTWPTSGNHVMVVSPTGTKNASSKSPRVDVDAFLTLD